MEQILLFLKPVIEAYSGSLGPAIQIITIVGSLRLVIKPIMEVIKAVVLITPSTSDDSIPSKIESNKIFKAVVFCLDWLASIKLKK